MALWFQKGYLRRFPRISMPLRIFVNPIKPIKDQHIFAFDLDYFPPTVRKKIEQSQQSLAHWVSHIQEQQDVLNPVFLELQGAVVYFGQCVESMSKGVSPKASRTDGLTFGCYLAGVASITGLKVTAPKTYQYFEQMNQKLKVYFQNMAFCIEGSTPTQLMVENPLPESMMIDDMVARFEAGAFAKIPLSQSLLHLHYLMEHYFQAYRELLKDGLSRQNPNAWPEVEVNISACGLSVCLEKRFKPNVRYDAYFYFAEKKRLMSVKAVLVRTFSDMVGFKEHNAFNFEFDEPLDQNFLQSEVERYEVKQSLQVPLN